MSEKVADAAAGAPEAATPDKRVDVEGVGGVMDANNESASKADAQVDVEGQGSTGVDDVSADAHEDVEKAVKTDDSGHTKTWGEGKGKFKPADPVGGKAFPTSAVYVADSGKDPNNDAGGGSAKQGTDPIDPVGKADERVDVLQQITVNNPQKGTDQWTGTDGNGVTKQQPAVTREVATPFTSSVVDILKLADAEVDLGLIEKDEKYDRIAELEQEAPEVVQASLAYVAKIKTAGLRRNASTRGGVGRVPSFGKAASIEDSAPTSAGPDDQMFW